MLQKRYAEVVDDCTKALEHNNRYIKALYRRAKAAEVTDNLMQSMEGDFPCTFASTVYAVVIQVLLKVVYKLLYMLCVCIVLC